MASLSPAVLVARFLRANNFEKTLEAFLEEARLPQDAGSTAKGDISLEQILREKELFDLSLNFEKLGVEDESKAWREPTPSIPTQLSGMPTSSNILNTSVENAAFGGATPAPFVMASTADRRLHILSSQNEHFNVHRSLTHVQDSPILAYDLIAGRYLLTSSMSGKLVLYDSKEEKVLDERKDHTKYAVRIASREQADGVWVATAGWDAKVFLYNLRQSNESTLRLEAPIATLVLPTNPEDLIFIEHPDTAKPLLLLTRRDSTFLQYYSLPDAAGGSAGLERPVTLQFLGKQNLAPASNAWIAFTPSSIALSPTDPSLLAVATSAVPHMKLIIARLLVPPATANRPGSFTEASGETSDAAVSQGEFATMNQASQAREALAVQERELAAILVQCSTLAPQTPYSTPSLAWRPDGSGVWVNGDDGLVRGIEAHTGKIVKTLKGHEPGSKIRCLWAGKVASTDGGEQEWLLSGGFDQRLILWRVPSRSQTP
ncbi:WD40-repeat-containing domain protein [Phyllosticta citriasiana]|uniref:WD40-repeat-containing domain protein n=1 Tax=Phyllosticta citriasiana TaxID=595635 RepID=UPI0030FDD9CD